MPKNRRKPSYLRKGMSYANTAVKALRLAQQTAQLLNSEYKYHFLSNTNAETDWDGAIGSLVQGISQGDQALSQRDGDSIKLKTLMVKGHVHYGTSPSQTTQVVRFMVIHDPAAAFTNANQILYDTGTAYAPYSVLSKDNNRAFRVLASRVMHINSESQPVPFKIILKDLNIRSRFDSAASTVSANDLLILIISNEDDLSTTSQKPKITYYSQLTYVDN
jgi:hypothetical protein